MNTLNDINNNIKNLTKTIDKGIINLANNLDDLRKTINKNFINLDKNFADSARSLRYLSIGLKEKADDYWHPVSGPNGSVPGKGYDWVLVKIKDMGINNKPYNCPHIAEFRNEKWYAQEWDKPYESDEVPFEVVYWRPIPGDEYDGINILEDLVEKEKSHDKA